MGFSTDHAIEPHPHPSPPLEGEGTNLFMCARSKRMMSVSYVWVFLFLWFAYAIYVVSLIRRSGQYEQQQQLLQTALAFVLPIVGALLVHFMYLASQSKEAKPDRHHIREENVHDGVMRNRQREDGGDE
jgi:hypothetical protein